MIKIEFKEAQIYLKRTVQLFIITDEFGLEQAKNIISKIFRREFSQLKSVTPYIPTQDPMLDRSEILKQLGISPEEDEQNQIKWSKL